MFVLILVISHYTMGLNNLHTMNCELDTKNQTISYQNELYYTSQTFDLILGYVSILTIFNILLSGPIGILLVPIIIILYAIKLIIIIYNIQT